MGDGRWDRRSCPHPKSLSLRERDFESGSLLPEGEGLGMRATNLRMKMGSSQLPASLQFTINHFLNGFSNLRWLNNR